MNRRDVMLATAALAGLGTRARAATANPATPSEDVGPYYPVVWPSESVADLTRMGGRRAAGQAIDLGVRVLDRQGKPLPKAVVVLWQGDADGRYPHPVEIRAADPGFAGHALLRTDSDGRFRLRSIMPGPYKARFLPGMRTSHIHFEVLHEGARLVTQMYFPDRPLNGQDALIRKLREAGGDPASVMATRADTSEPGTIGYRWDMTLA